MFVIICSSPTQRATCFFFFSYLGDSYAKWDSSPWFMTQSPHWSMFDHLWFYLCLFMFNNATHTPITQPPNLRTITLPITHLVGWSMAHFPQEVTAKIFINRVSLDLLWGLHSVEHKACVKKDETTRYSLTAVGWAAQD